MCLNTLFLIPQAPDISLFFIRENERHREGRERRGERDEERETERERDRDRDRERERNGYLAVQCEVIKTSSDKMNCKCLSNEICLLFRRVNTLYIHLTIYTHRHRHTHTHAHTKTHFVQSHQQNVPEIGRAHV